jgi:hypothetical protein
MDYALSNRPHTRSKVGRREQEVQRPGVGDVEPERVVRPLRGLSLTGRVPGRFTRRGVAPERARITAERSPAHIQWSAAPPARRSCWRCGARAWSSSTTAATATLDLVGDVLLFAFTSAVVLFLYRVLPGPRPRTREIWPGAVVAAALVSVTRGALGLSFERLADFGALYRSLGALMALLTFVYAVSLILVFGAEYASEWSRAPETS